jgi:hypothetical protein
MHAFYYLPTCLLVFSSAVTDYDFWSSPVLNNSNITDLSDIRQASLEEQMTHHMAYGYKEKLINTETSQRPEGDWNTRSQRSSCPRHDVSSGM